MDWTTWAQLWGPAVPIFAVFVYYLHLLVFKNIPQGFSHIVLSMRKEGRKAALRHDEAMTVLKRVEVACGKCAAKQTRTNKKTSPGKGR